MAVVVSGLFGLGGILCHILTGEPPFRGESAGGALRQAAAGELGDAFARLAACGADVELVMLCRQCLSPNPADRPADAGAVARAISESPDVVSLRVTCTAVAGAIELDCELVDATGLALGGFSL